MKDKVSYTGPGLLSIVFVVLLVLKLIPGTVVSSWSWWIVFLPLIIQFIIIAIIFIILLIAVLVSHK